MLVRAASFGISAYGILLISLATTFAGWYVVSEVVTQRALTRFDAEALTAARAMEREADRYEAALYGVRGLLESSEEVTQDEFRLYIDVTGLLKKYPGLTGVGYAMADGNPGSMRRLFMEPPLPTGQSATPDFLLDDNRRAALEQARDSGRASITHSTALRQIGKTGFLVLIPIYHNGVRPTIPATRRASFVGTVFGRVEADLFFENIVERQQLKGLEFLV